MTRPPRTRSRKLRSILKGCVAHGAMDFACYPFLYVVYLDADYDNAAAAHDGTLSFLARVRLWLQLLWGGSSSAFDPQCVHYHMTDNRHRVRKRQRKACSRRQACLLGYHIYRRKGLKACREWLYKYSLTWRLGWCLRRHRERGAGYRPIAQKAKFGFAFMLCGAPLKPD